MESYNFHWAFSALTILVIVLSIIMIMVKNDSYFAYDKEPWANNIRVLGMLTAISLILFSFACQIGSRYDKIIAPFLCLTLSFFLLWIYSLTFMVNFTFTCISSWIVFLLVLTMMIILGMQEKLLSVIVFPLLVITILMVSISHDIALNNVERENTVIY